MAITSAEVHNQSFSIDRKGYDVDEVDVFLERVAEEIDEMNAQISRLESQLENQKFEGFDASTTALEMPAVDQSALFAKDSRISELERQLEAKKADDNAIAQALIIAQRSADEIIANANATSAATVKDAEIEAQRILDKADSDKQKVLDAIKKLEDDREGARGEYQSILTDFITDATRKLAEIGGDTPGQIAPSHMPSHFVHAGQDSSANKSTSSVQVPIKRDGTGAYSMPSATSGVMVAPATPKPSNVEKDLSGFGDAADAFEFGELD